MISKPVTRPDGPSQRRPCADQRQGLGDIVAARAHVGRAPGAEGHRPRPVAVGLGVVLHQELGRFPAELPGRGGRHLARVHRVEVPAGGQNVRPPARRRAGGAGCDEAAVERAEQAGGLGLRARI